MKKLAVLTAVVFMFGVAGVAGAQTNGFVPIPSNQVNGNDIVGGGGTNANDSGTAVAVKDTLNGNQTLSNNNVPVNSGNTETTNVSKPVTVTKTETETTNVNKQVGAEQAAANNGSTAVGLKDSANGNSLLSGNSTAVGSGNTKTETEAEASKGSVAVSNSGTITVSPNLHVPGETVSTTANPNTSKTNAENYNKQEAEASTGGAATLIGDATTTGSGNRTDTEAEKGSTVVSSVNGDANYTPNNHVPGETLTTNANPNSSKVNSDQKYKAEDGSQLAIGGGSNTMNKAEDGGMVATGGSNYSVEAEKGSAATVTGNASVDSRDQSTHTYVKADAENGSLSAINTTGNITLDKSINLSNIGVALQNTELDGKVEDNKLIVGGPEATSITKSGTTKSGYADSGKAESGEAESGEAETKGAFVVSGSKSKSGSNGAAAFGKSKSGSNGAASFGGAKAESEAIAVAVDPSYSEGQTKAKANSGQATANPANTADASSGTSSNTSAANSTSGASDSQSNVDAATGSATSGAATSGAANSGAANSGDANGGNATSAAVTATTNFSTGNNNFTSGSFNGIGAFNVNSGISSLNQSSINVNAVVGGNLAGR